VAAQLTTTTVSPDSPTRTTHSDHHLDFVFFAFANVAEKLALAVALDAADTGYMDLRAKHFGYVLLRGAGLPQPASTSRTRIGKQ
jgi:hypothetical protein